MALTKVQPSGLDETKDFVVNTLTANTVHANGTIIFPDGTVQETAWLNVAFIDTWARDEANTKYDITGGTITGSATIEGQLNVYQTMVVGQGAPAILPDLVAQFTANSSSYIQINVQNIDGAGSSDIVATANNGTDSAYYVDVGIQGSECQSGDILYPNDTYLIGQGLDGYQPGSNLVIATTTATYGDIVIAQGGLEAQHEVARFTHGQGLVVQKDISSNNLTVSNFIDLQTDTNPSKVEGRLFYDAEQHALGYYNESDMTVQISQESIVRVWNNSGSTISDGLVVKFTPGSSGGFPAIGLAMADTAANSAVAGVTTTSIANNAFGYVTQRGKVNGLSTELFTPNQPLYLSATTPGGLVGTAPAVPALPYVVGRAVNIDAVSGSIQVQPVAAPGANFTTGSIFIAKDGLFVEDDQLFFDITNHRLGIGTQLPTANLHVSGDALFTGNVEINGNLIISNAQSISTTTLTVEGNEIILNQGVSGSPTTNAFITINRGSSPNVFIQWDENIDEWRMSEASGDIGHIISSAKTANTWDVYSGWASYEKETHPIGANLANATNELAKTANTYAAVALSTAIDAEILAQAAFDQANTGGGVSSLTSNSTSRITQSSTTGAVAIDLAVSGAIAGTYSYPYLNVDAYGRVTSIDDQTPVTSWNGLTGDVNLSSANVVSALGFTPADQTYAAAAFIKANSAFLTANSVGPGSNNIGYLNIPQNSQSADYTIVAGDSGKHIFHPAADTTGRTFTIPSHATTPFEIGTTVVFINDASAGTITIAIDTNTLLWLPSGGTGSRTLAASGMATCVKVTSAKWIITGVGIT